VETEREGRGDAECPEQGENLGESFDEAHSFPSIDARGAARVVGPALFLGTGAEVGSNGVRQRAGPE
jgi:hypothetical protein